jgi:hypothetical protein
VKREYRTHVGGNVILFHLHYLYKVENMWYNSVVHSYVNVNVSVNCERVCVCVHTHTRTCVHTQVHRYYSTTVHVWYYTTT